MTTPNVGEIRMFAGNFNPAGWMICAGQLLPISGYDALFNLIGTTYGGDGQSNFALPDLRSRVPIHMGTGGGANYVLGQAGGVETVTLTVAQIPSHGHAVNATTSGATESPSLNTFPANSAPANRNVYGPYGGAPATLNNGTIGQTVGNQPHDNTQPYLAINFIISLFGVYPTQN